MIILRAGIALAFTLLSITPALQAGDTICNTALSGGSYENILVPSFATCTILNAQVDGNVLVQPGGAVTISGRTYIDGNVQSDGGRFVRLLGRGVTVNGDVQIKKSTKTSTIQPGTSILGNLQFEENSGFLAVTSSFIAGDLQFFKNSGGGTFVNNTIRQNLQCKENNPPPTGGGNRVGGSKEDQCIAF